MRRVQWTAHHAATTHHLIHTPGHPLQLPQEHGRCDRRALLCSTSLVALWNTLETPAAQAIDCPGLNGYALRKCLKEARLAREAAEGQQASAPVEDTPGTLVTLPSGVRYREYVEGTTGPLAEIGYTLEIQYTVYRLTRGNNAVLLWALGSGFENQDDFDEVYRFRLGDDNSLPAAVTPAVVGMRVGGRRRVLVPPSYGWVNDQVQPRPLTFSGQRRLATHFKEPLLVEVSLVRCIAPARM